MRAARQFLVKLKNHHLPLLPLSAGLVPGEDPVERGPRLGVDVPLLGQVLGQLLPAGGAVVGLGLEAPLEAGQADVVAAGRRDGLVDDVHADDTPEQLLHEVSQLLPVGRALLLHLRERCARGVGERS